MTLASLTIPGEPVAWARTRISRVGKLFTPARVRRWQRAAALDMHAQFRSEPLSGPVVLYIDAYWPRPKSMKPGPRAPRMGLEDWDNLGKCVSDAAQGVLYENDRQVVEGIVRKWYCGTGQRPRVEVLFGPWTEALAVAVVASG